MKLDIFKIRKQTFLNAINSRDEQNNKNDNLSKNIKSILNLP